jgi:hypothetical protein
MRQTTPADRDRAQRRVRSITFASVAGAGVLTVVGAAITAGTFAGRTVNTTPGAQSTPTAEPTLDPSTGLLPPLQPPSDNSGGSVNSGSAPQPVVSGGS